MVGGVSRLTEMIEMRREQEKNCIFYGKYSITYKELYEKSVSLLELLTDEQLGNNVGLLLPNSIDYALAYFAILSRGKTVVPIPVHSKNNEIVNDARYCEINVFVTDEEGAAKIKSIVENGFLERIIVYIISKHRVEELVYYPNSTFLCLKCTEENKDVAVMLHTSGTTSNPKRVMLTHKGLLYNIKSNVKSLKLDEHDTCLISLPMCFGYCNTSQFLTHLYIGGTMVILDSIFTAKAFFVSVQNYRITNFTAVPTMLKILDSFSKFDEYDISSLRYLCFGGGNISTELINSVAKKMKTVGVVQTYGQTEAGPRVTALLPQDFEGRRDSVGKAIPDVIVKVVDDDGKDCKDGIIGNIIVKSPAIMKGYYKNKIATSKVLVEGWLYTGDMGYLDNGFLYLKGRRKNIIICGGLNIYPEEIEELYQMIEGVEDVRVYGIPDDMWGEIPIADVKIAEGYEFEKIKGKIHDTSLQKLSDYKIPREIKAVDNFERTYTGKIKRELTEQNT